jgi:hypothetical protein
VYHCMIGEGNLSHNLLVCLSKCFVILADDIFWWMVKLRGSGSFVLEVIIYLFLTVICGDGLMAKYLKYFRHLLSLSMIWVKTGN